ncbi:hypothetical protein EMIT0111MI5_20216 [Burkholderia sp. IT-111MI5]
MQNIRAGILYETPKRIGLVRYVDIDARMAPGGVCCVPHYRLRTAVSPDAFTHIRSRVPASPVRNHRKGETFREPRVSFSGEAW